MLDLTSGHAAEGKYFPGEPHLLVAGVLGESDSSEFEAEAVAEAEDDSPSRSGASKARIRVVAQPFSTAFWPARERKGLGERLGSLKVSIWSCVYLRTAMMSVVAG